MFVCIFFIYRIKISILLTDLTHYVTISSWRQAKTYWIALYLSFFNVDIADSHQTGWMLIYGFTMRTCDFVGHITAYISIYLMCQ